MFSECLAFLLLVLAAPECAPGASELHVDPVVGGVETAVVPEHRDSEPDGLDDAAQPVSRSSIGRNVVLIGGATALVTLANPDVRRGVFTEGSLSHIAHNFRHPVRRAVEGGREDDDAFIHNGIAHPLSWGGMAYYLRQQGYSRHGALLFTQLHSVVWEYVIEGSYQKPSGKDLVTNFLSAAASVMLFPDGLSSSTDPPGLAFDVAF